MSVTPDDIRHIAQLARLGVPDERVPALVAELNGILNHMQTLQSVNLSSLTNLDATADRALDSMPLRDDASSPVRLDRDRSEFAPQTRDGFFLVPRLSTHGASASKAAGNANDADGDDE